MHARCTEQKKKTDHRITRATEAPQARARLRTCARMGGGDAVHDPTFLIFLSRSPPPRPLFPPPLLPPPTRVFFVAAWVREEKVSFFPPPRSYPLFSPPTLGVCCVFFHSLLRPYHTMATSNLDSCDAALKSVLTNHGVHEDVVEALVSAGVTTLATFANVSDSASDFAMAVADMVPALGTWGPPQKMARMAAVRAAYRDASAKFEQSLLPEPKSGTAPPDHDDVESMGENDRTQLVAAFLARYGHEIPLEIQGGGKLLARLRKCKASGVAEMIHLSRALPATTLVGEDRVQNLGRGVTLRLSDHEVAKARFMDGPWNYLYHLRVLMMSYVIVSLDVQGDEEAWCSLTAANNHISLVERAFRADGRFQDRSFRTIAAVDESVRHEWRKASIANPGSTLTQVMEKTAERFHAAWPTDAQLRTAWETTGRRVTLVPRGGGSQTAGSKPPQKKPRNLKTEEVCKLHAEGKCMWGANCRRKHD